MFWAQIVAGEDADFESLLLLINLNSKAANVSWESCDFPTLCQCACEFSQIECACVCGPLQLFMLFICSTATTAEQNRGGRGVLQRRRSNKRQPCRRLLRFHLASLDVAEGNISFTCQASCTARNQSWFLISKTTKYKKGLL